MSFLSRLFFFFAFFLTCNHNLLAQNSDIELLRKINLQRNTQLDGTMKFISNSEAFIGVGLPVSIVVASYIKEDKRLLQKGIDMSLALVASSASTFILKRIVNRQRPAYTYPDIQAFETQQYYSFPSGHTSNAFCTAASLSLNFPKWYVIAPSFVWACAAGYSRMHLGVHYPSDVFAGALLGVGSAYVTYKADKMLRKYFARKYAPAAE